MKADNLEWQLRQALVREGAEEGSVILLGTSKHVDDTIRSFVFDVVFPEQIPSAVTVKLVPERRFNEFGLNSTIETNVFRGFDNAVFVPVFDRREYQLPNGERYFGFATEQDPYYVPSGTPGLVIHLPDITSMGIAVARALRAVHTARNIIHGDITPENFGAWFYKRDGKKEQPLTREQVLAHIKENPGVPLHATNPQLRDYNAAISFGDRIRYFTNGTVHPNIQSTENPTGIPIFANASADGYQLSKLLFSLANKDGIRSHHAQALRGLRKHMDLYVANPQSNPISMETVIYALETPARRARNFQLGTLGILTAGLLAATSIQYTRYEQTRTALVQLQADSLQEVSVSAALKQFETLPSTERAAALAMRRLGTALTDKFRRVANELPQVLTLVPAMIDKEGIPTTIGIEYGFGDDLVQTLYFIGDTLHARAAAYEKLKQIHEQGFALASERNLRVASLWSAYQDTKDIAFLNGIFVVGSYLQELAKERKKLHPVLSLPYARSGTSTSQLRMYADVEPRDGALLETLLTVREAARLVRADSTLISALEGISPYGTDEQMYSSIIRELTNSLAVLVEEGRVHAHVRLGQEFSRSPVVISVDQARLAYVFAVTGDALGDTSLLALSDSLMSRLPAGVPPYALHDPDSSIALAGNPTSDAAVYRLAWQKIRKRPIAEQNELVRALLPFIPSDTVLVSQKYGEIRDKRKELIGSVCYRGDPQFCPASTYETDGLLLRVLH